MSVAVEGWKLKRITKGGWVWAYGECQPARLTACVASTGSLNRILCSGRVAVGGGGCERANGGR